MKLTQLKNSEVLPQRIEMNDVAVTCNKKCVDIGVNKTVSSLEKVELVWDEEELAIRLHSLEAIIPWDILLPKSVKDMYRLRAQSLIQSQHLFLSLRRSE